VDRVHTSWPLAAIDEKSAAIVVAVRTILLDQHVDIFGAPSAGLHGRDGSVWPLSPFGSVLFGTPRSADAVPSHHHEQAWENNQNSSSRR
jgi:hypothetical protein